MSECLVKAAHIVLATRLSALGSAAPKASTRDKTNRWFNLETEEVESATPALERWKRDASSPLVMEIFGRKLQQAAPAIESINFDIELVARSTFTPRNVPAATPVKSASIT